MNRLKMTLLSGIVVLGVSCSANETTVSTKMETVTLANGKQYSVPVGVVYTKEPVTDKVIAKYTEFGVKGCKKGDITWETQDVADSINKVMRDNSSKEAGVAIYKKAAQAGTMGCSSSL